MRFTLRQLEYFAALIRHQNFGRAAEACNVSQPALSVQIRTLEDMLGGALVERRARSVVLTPFGRQLLPLIQSTLVSAQTLEFAAAGKGALQGSLSLGLIPTVAPYLLPGTLEKIRSLDISLQIDVREAPTETLISELLDGNLDAAVIAVPNGGNGLTELPLFEDRFLLAAAVDSEGLGAISQPTDLDSSPLMLLEDGHCLTDQALDVCNRDRAQAGINTGASSLATLARLVEAGFGLTLIPETAAGTEARHAPRLTLRRFRTPEPARMIGLVRRSATPEGEWFVQLAQILTGVGESLTAEARALIT